MDIVHIGFTYLTRAHICRKLIFGVVCTYDSLRNTFRIFCKPACCNLLDYIIIRDVIFDEDQVFAIDGNLETLRDDCLNIDLDDLSALLTQLDVSQRHENDPIDPISDDLLADDDCILVENPGALDETVSGPDEGQDLI